MNSSKAAWVMAATLLCAALTPIGVFAQDRPDPAVLMAAWREALAKLSFLDGVWHETGDRLESGKPPVRFFEMTLKRVGDSDWPAAGAAGAK